MKCASYFFSIVVGIFCIMAFSAVNKVCSLVSTRVGPFYIIFFMVFLFLIQFFVFWGQRWDLNLSLSRLWLKLFMNILGQYLISLCL
jgi:hypothetical protein